MRKTTVNWAVLRTQICDDRARGRCECAGQCGVNHGPRCPARQGHQDDSGEWIRLHPEPLDGVLWHTTPQNLLAMCQACRARYNSKGLAKPEPEEAPEGLFDLPQVRGKDVPTL